MKIQNEHENLRDWTRIRATQILDGEMDIYMMSWGEDKGPLTKKYQDNWEGGDDSSFWDYLFDCIHKEESANLQQRLKNASILTNTCERLIREGFFTLVETEYFNKVHQEEALYLFENDHAKECKEI